MSDVLRSLSTNQHTPRVRIMPRHSPPIRAQALSSLWKLVNMGIACELQRSLDLSNMVQGLRQPAPGLGSLWPELGTNITYPISHMCVKFCHVLALPRPSRLHQLFSYSGLIHDFLSRGYGNRGVTLVRRNSVAGVPTHTCWRAECVPVEVCAHRCDRALLPSVCADVVRVEFK